jgi:hypothetical protein
MFILALRINLSTRVLGNFALEEEEKQMTGYNSIDMMGGGSECYGASLSLHEYVSIDKSKFIPLN